ncbi:MAG: cytochrome-c oxidase [Candidatus Aramenus sulfurataquae]|uniref:Cytochrome-c oxidase n=2 Tax=Candidatus Aramenus sulfurataquae TaxID=1326980 RepID=W7KUL5_9CREN|nr:MAG: cytochrome-c oxidase [Candidatus Aramenus sulfurataquae]MCL7343573.1 hypothetical protein [Candidatus Aramenus sulfurataquae]
MNAVFQLDKDWISRMTMSMTVLSLVWGILGIIDTLAARLQEAVWATSQSLVITSQEYYGSITLHGVRDLFGFAVQLEMVIADVATLLWLGNLVITLLKGRTTGLEGLSVGEVISTVAMQLEVPKEIMADIGKIGERLNLVKIFTRK